jgi:hypothetical protein
VFLALGEAVAVAVSALSLLAGGVVMVAGAISIGLVGGLLAAVPLMLGLAGAIGVVAIAFSNMSEAQKKSLEPLKKQLGAIGDEVAKTFLRDLPIWIKGASQLLTDFAGPTMQKVASGVRDALTGIVKDFQTPEIRAALAIWGTSIAQIASALTTAFGKGLEGAISFFVPILPYAIQLANYIKDMATTFANWAASAEGQNAIRAFMEKAIPIAQDLWKIIVDIGRAIGSLLTQGSDAGGAGFLDWLSTKAQELREFLDSPQGQNKLSEWFADAKTFGTQLFETLGSVKDTLVALDTPANRAFATNLVTALGKVTEAIGILTPAFQVAGVAMGAMLAIAAKAFGTLLMVIGQVSTKMGEFLVAISVIPGFGWALDAGKNLATMGNSAEEAGKKIFAIPDELNILINGDPKDLEAAAAVAMGAIEEVDPTSNTNFVGNTSGINDASAAATRLITGVKPSWMTDFQGQKFDLQRAADESRGAIVSVPNDKTSYFKGADTTLGRAVAQANTSITGVPDSAHDVLPRRHLRDSREDRHRSGADQFPDGTEQRAGDGQRRPWWCLRDDPRGGCRNGAEGSPGPVGRGGWPGGDRAATAPPGPRGPLRAWTVGARPRDDRTERPVHQRRRGCDPGDGSELQPRTGGCGGPRPSRRSVRLITRCNRRRLGCSFLAG